MTRWARAGNCQRHQKIPGEATKWGEFDLQKEGSTSKNKNDTELNSNSNATDFSAKKKANKIKKHKNKKKPSAVEMSNDGAQSKNEIQNNHLSSITSETNCDDSQKEKKNLKRSNQQQNISVENVHTKKRKLDEEDNLHSKNIEASTSKTFESKKSKYLEKLQRKRAKNGILLLPAKIERKLYNIKRRLREKNVPAATIVKIIRTERRKEELNFRKVFAPNKLCFNCRQPGHILADCPEKLGSSNQETGICFKCGSKEHSSFSCTEKVQGFPFAKCFICKEQGHISKDCPNNKHGVYPKGGRCNICGNVNHLKKDCPTLSKKADHELTVTLPMIDGISSIDADVSEKTQVKREKVKRPKIVKF